MPLRARHSLVSLSSDRWREETWTHAPAVDDERRGRHVARSGREEVDRGVRNVVDRAVRLERDLARVLLDELLQTCVWGVRGGARRAMSRGDAPWA